jgi:hypothetical protein
LGPALAGLCNWRAVLEDGQRPGRMEQGEVLGAALVQASKCGRASRSRAGALLRVGARGGGEEHCGAELLGAIWSGGRLVAECTQGGWAGAELGRVRGRDAQVAVAVGGGGGSSQGAEVRAGARELRPRARGSRAGRGLARMQVQVAVEARGGASQERSWAIGRAAR